MAGTVRMSAEERRRSVLHAARIEFGVAGYSAATTDAIARRVGVSQPYLFRLFPNKRAIFLATVEDCFDQLERLFTEAAEGHTGEDALSAMGTSYNALVEDRAILQMQLQMWATACQDDDVRAVARRRMGRLWQLVGRLSGADEQRVMEFMARGMLINVFAAMALPRGKGLLAAALAAAFDT
jgi:AcrR family transcriptional regulator